MSLGASAISDTQGVNKAELLALVEIAAHNPLRTHDEQQALLSIIKGLDNPPITWMHTTRAIVESNWVRAHVCDCGTRSSQYWCSAQCFNLAEPAEEHDDDDRDDDDAEAAA